MPLDLHELDGAALLAAQLPARPPWSEPQPSWPTASAAAGIVATIVATIAGTDATTVAERGGRTARAAVPRCRKRRRSQPFRRANLVRYTVVQPKRRHFSNCASSWLERDISVDARVRSRSRATAVCAGDAGGSLDRAEPPADSARSGSGRRSARSGEAAGSSAKASVWDACSAAQDAPDERSGRATDFGAPNADGDGIRTMPSMRRPARVLNAG